MTKGQTKLKKNKEIGNKVTAYLSEPPQIGLMILGAVVIIHQPGVNNKHMVIDP